MEGPEVSYIASGGNRDLYAVGLNDKKLWKMDSKDNTWETMGLDNVLKVAGGIDDEVYALIEGDVLVKYSKRKQKWLPFGDKGNGVKVTVDGKGTVFL